MEIPQPSEIIAVATSMGYKERRPEVSSTLFFEERNPSHDMPPVLLNIYYTTRSIMTYLNHPTQGTNELWRSNAYQDIEELKTFLENPRRHSGKGYRNKNKAVRGCAQCGEFKERMQFSRNQWIVKGPDFNKCKDCIAKSKSLDNESDISQLTDRIKGVTLGNNEENNELKKELGKLTEDLLNLHNQAHNNSKNSSKALKNTHNRMERRQFNCPKCPKEGRGRSIFFKKVPAYKPVCKCPKCKSATQGKCDRLYPIPKSEERGYGLFKCNVCKDTWGSSCAVASLGQQCFTCKKNGLTTLVRPFRLEVLKKMKKVTNRNVHRVPHEPIAESEEIHYGYTPRHESRNTMAGGNALVGGGGGGGGGGERRNSGGYSRANASYSFQERSPPPEKEERSESEAITPVSTPVKKEKVGVPSDYEHYCEGCDTGKCRNRKVPKSEIHDVSDGDTVSTSASVITNSSIDKSEFIDRDPDFDDIGDSFDEDVRLEWV